MCSRTVCYFSTCNMQFVISMDGMAQKSMQHKSDAVFLSSTVSRSTVYSYCYHIIIIILLLLLLLLLLFASLWGVCVYACDGVYDFSCGRKCFSSSSCMWYAVFFPQRITNDRIVPHAPYTYTLYRNRNKCALKVL